MTIDLLRDTLKSLVLMPQEDAIERIRCSRQYFDKLMEYAYPYTTMLKIGPPQGPDFAVEFCGVAVHVDPLLPNVMAAVIYKSGRSMLVYEDGKTVMLPSMKEQMSMSIEPLMPALWPVTIP